MKFQTSEVDINAYMKLSCYPYKKGEFGPRDRYAFRENIGRCRQRLGGD